LGLLACWISKTADKPHHNSYEIPKEKYRGFQQSNISILIAIALTGFAAMVCEVVWTRVLILVLGASVYAYTMVISIFLAGLGMGSWSTATLLGKLTTNGRRAFFVLALLSALLVCLSSVGFRYLPNLFVKIYWAFNLRENFGNILYVQLIICWALMFLPAFIMGGLFPAAARVIVSKASKSGYYTGRLYASNTIGAIIGSFAAGFIFIPLIGIRNSIITAATVQVIGAVTSIISPDNKRTNLKAIITSTFVIIIILIITPQWHKQLMVSGIYHYVSSYSGLSTNDLSNRLKSKGEILFYRDGLTSTVTVTNALLSKHKSLYISTNGKIDGSSYSDMPTQRLLAHLPILFHPDPEKICVIGMGTGCTAGSASLYPKSNLTVVEIEKEMVEGARLFRDHNYNVHENPKVNIKVTDGRLFLNLNPNSFDVIISEPSNPWLAGTSDLFTQEFYKIGSRSLLKGGIFCQWVQLYNMSAENLKAMVRTFASIFNHLYLASTIIDTDILLLGSNHPIQINPKKIKQQISVKEIKLDLADPRVKINNVFELLARIRMGTNEIQKLAGDGPLHTDDLPIIAYRAPMDLYKYTRKDNMDLISRHAKGIAPYLMETINPAAGNQDFYRNLADAYRNFLKEGREIDICEQLGS
jgi:spermidine synthase